MAAGQVLLMADHDGCHFEIQEGRGEGYYVFRFVAENPVSTHDYLQDNLVQAKGFVKDKWNVPEDAWKPVLPGQTPRLLLARKTSKGFWRRLFGSRS